MFVHTLGLKLKNSAMIINDDYVTIINTTFFATIFLHFLTESATNFPNCTLF